MSCREGFRAGGEISLLGAHIAGQLSFDGATLTSTGLAVDLEAARVDGELSLLFAERPAGGVDLTAARLGRVLDSERTWPMRVQLGGCVYAGVETVDDAHEQPEEQGAQSTVGLPAWLRWRLRPGGPPDLQQRLRWIQLAEESRLDLPPGLQRPEQHIASASRRPAGYAPQPYTQLMAFYRQEGRDGDARRVGYERERRRRSQLALVGRTWNLFLQWTVGYGYRPLRALVLLGVLVLVGTLIFSSFHSSGDLKAVREEHPPFVASIYTLDRLIPVVSFGLRDAFAPTQAAQWWAFAFTLLGWALTVAVVAGLNAAVRRD